jgi:acyl carrier protein
MAPDVERSLKRILVERFGYRIAPDQITAGTPLMGKGLGLSSLDVVALVVALEETFDVVFEAEDMSGMIATFGTLAAALHAKLAAGAPEERGAGD